MTIRGRPIRRRKYRSATMTCAPWMVSRKWRACNRGGPSSGATRATMLETSRRWLSRFKTGDGRPVPRWCRRGPETSDPSRPRRQPHARDGEPPFDPRPVPPQPGRDDRLVALLGPRDRTLGAPAPGPQRPAQRVTVVPHTELPLDDRRNPALGPAVGLEAGTWGTPTPNPEEVAPLGRRQGRHPPGGRATPQAAEPVLVQLLLPAGHRDAAHAPLPGNRGLRRLLAAQETRRHQPALRHLLAGEASRLPSHGSTSQRSHSP